MSRGIQAKPATCATCPREEPIVERRASISPVGPPPATTTACPVIAAPRPASRRPPPARRAPATAPRPPPSVRRPRATRTSTTTHAFRHSHLRGFRLRPALCGTTGGLKQAPGALYIGSGRRRPANRTGHGSFGPGRIAAPALLSCPYSPECVEGKFCELRLYGVQRSSPPRM